MARAVLFLEGATIKERGLRVPKNINKIEAWSKAALKTFRRELGPTVGSRECPMKLVKHQYDANFIRLGYADGHGILIDRLASPLG